MIIIDNISVMNFQNAFRGLRNPLNSWEKSDSFFGLVPDDYIIDEVDNVSETYLDINKASLEEIDEKINWLLNNGTNFYLQPDQSYFDVTYCAFLGKKDLDLGKRMVLAGNDEGKFARQIFVSMDIDAPFYWWKELDTYKVGTVANSCSTMHKLASTPITKDCFSLDCGLDGNANFDPSINKLITDLEYLRIKYNETQDKCYWRALVQLLPNAWNQKRTWTANYQVLRNIYFARRNHKLEEWHVFCNLIEQLPYAKELITCTKEIKEN